MRRPKKLKCHDPKRIMKGTGPAGGIVSPKPVDEKPEKNSGEEGGVEMLQRKTRKGRTRITSLGSEEVAVRAVQKKTKSTAYFNSEKGILARET